MNEEAEAIKQAKKEVIDQKKKEGTWLSKKELAKKRVMDNKRA